jgi:ATP-dependent Clp protease ATP-binding subunit ClpC
VILFDEVEKAHPEVLNILLQVLDDGFLTDARGRKVSFANTIIIMTSNVGTSLLNEAAVGFKTTSAKSTLEYEELKRRVMGDLKKRFRPEFINRVDQVIVFRPLSPQDVASIVKLQIQELQERLKARGIIIKVNPAAQRFLAENGFEPELGARPVRRLIQNLIESPLAELLVERGTLKGVSVERDSVGLKLKVLK